MLKKFNFEANAVRVQCDADGATWFNATDVCDALGFVNARKSVADHVYDEDITKREVTTDGGSQLANFVNESGLYALIFGSTKPEAKRFKRWVTHEVLPAIRRTGAYAIQAPAANPPAAISPTKAARLYCDTFAMARQSGMSPEACHQLAAQTKYEASGWWWQFKEVPKGALLAGPGKPLQICTN